MHSMLQYQMYRTLAADRVEQRAPSASPSGAGTRRRYADGRRTPRRGSLTGWTPSPPGARSHRAPARPLPGAGLCSRRGRPAPRALRAVHHPRRLRDPRAGRRAHRQRRQPVARAGHGPAGRRTEAHFHRASEEIYVFTAGAGRMILGDEQSAVRAGDCVVIAPGTAHQLVNDGAEPLVLLCCCSPPYSDADTVILPPGTWPAPPGKAAA